MGLLVLSQVVGPQTRVNVASSADGSSKNRYSFVYSELRGLRYISIGRFGCALFSVKRIRTGTASEPEELTAISKKTRCVLAGRHFDEAQDQFEI
jgi:hypothetical protein